MKESYHKPVGLTAEQHDNAREKARGLERDVAFIFSSIIIATPLEVFRQLGGIPLITSVRRAISNLTRDEILHKLDYTIDEMNGAPNHVWYIDKAKFEEVYGKK